MLGLSQASEGRAAMSIKSAIVLGWAVMAAGYIAWCWWKWTGDPNQYAPFWVQLWLPPVGGFVVMLVALWRVRGIPDNQ